MKKKLLGFLILPILVMASVTREGNNQISTWAKETYAVETHGSSALKMMYEREPKSFEWVNEHAKEKGVLKRNSPQEYSYSALELMYKGEPKSFEWVKEHAKGKGVLKRNSLQEYSHFALELMYNKVS